MKKLYSKWAILCFSGFMVFSGFCFAKDDATQNIASANPESTAKIETSSKIENSANKNVNYFLIQSAAKGSIQIQKNAGNTYTIVLHHISPYLSYFSDRPNRSAGQITLQKYLELWSKKGVAGYKNNPPNAILHAMVSASSQSSQPSQGAEAANHEPNYYAFEISEPKYDSAAQTLSYVAKPLNGGNNGKLPEAAELNHVTLFIDDVCLSCWGE